MRSSIIAVITLIGLLVAPAAADDIKLKSGETLTNVKVKKKTEKSWSLVMLDGQRRRIAASDVAEHVEKPTVGDEIDAKAKALKKKDAAGHFELAVYAMDQGATGHGKKLLAKVVKIDKEHVEARAMLGHEKCDDGKWRYGKSLMRYKAKAEDAKKKAMGWVKIGGEYVDPLTAKRLKAGLVEHDGRWIPKDDVAKLEAGMVWLEGQWYSAEEKAKVDQGMRKTSKGKWKTLKELDTYHRAKANPPWELESPHFVVKAHKSHRLCTTLLKHLEGSWAPLADLCGDEPLIGSTKDKIVVNIFPDRNTHAAAMSVHGGDDRVSHYSSRQGGHYSSQSGEISVYYHSEEYLLQWTLHAAGNAFLAKLIGYGKCSSNIYEAVGCYAQGHAHGKFWMWDTMTFNGFYEWEPKEIRNVLTEFDVKKQLDSKSQEAAVARLSFFVYYAVTKHPEITKPFMRQYLTKGSSHRDLLKALEAAAGGSEGLTKEYTECLEAYKEQWQKWKKPSP